MAVVHGETDGGARWSAFWERNLPVLAVIGPGLVFVAALIRAAGIGTLAGDLDWASRPEAFFMVLGVPLLVATFIVLGRRTAERAPRAGITVTALGVLGVTALAAISSFRLFAA